MLKFKLGLGVCLILFTNIAMADDLCLSTSKYKLYSSSKAIINSNNWVKNYQGILDKQDRIYQTSGVNNLQVRYNAGQAIETHKENIKKSFNIYKNNGGTASSPQNVKLLPNPCS